MCLDAYIHKQTSGWVTSQHCSENVLSFLSNQVRFLVYGLLFQKCSWPEIWTSCVKFPYLLSDFYCVLGGGEGDFRQRKFWRIFIQGCLFYFCFNVRMQFSPLACFSFQMCCNKGLSSCLFCFHGLYFLAEQQIHWEHAWGFRLILTSVKTKSLKFKFSNGKNVTEKISRYVFFLRGKLYNWYWGGSGL